jgi:hypothetical protein
MKKKLLSILIIVLTSLIYACSKSEGESEKNPIEALPARMNQVEALHVDKDSSEVFTNMEQIEYCLPLPLNEYTEDYDKSDVKAKHVFKHKTKKDNEITVQGMFRDDPSVSIEEYFKNSYQDSEEQGEIVEKKELFKDKNCFYAKGYMSNLIDKYKFIEVVWLRKDEVVVYSSTYDIADTTLWDEQLRVLLNSSTNCN